MQEKVSIDAVIENARNEMLRLAYSKKTIEAHEGVWKQFRKYAHEHEEIIFTTALAEEFLSATFNYPQIYNEGMRIAHRTRNKIRAIRVLQDFHFLGAMPGKLMPPPKDCPEPFNGIYSKYRIHCIAGNRSKKCAEKYARTALQLAIFLQKRGINSYNLLDASAIDDFVILQQGYTKHTVKMKFGTLKTFLCYLYEEGYIEKDFSNRIPHVRIYAKGHIPDVLSDEQVKCLIESFDRGNPIGKRDFAVIITALELGLRCSDISNLRFEHIDWKQKRIRIAQEKTTVPLELPLPTRTANAIIEYMKYGRPKSKSPFVFIKHTAPYGYFPSLYDVMQRALSGAGIHLEQDVSQGLHLLRHTLGTNLLKKGVPRSTIAEILGQRDVITTEIYLHADTENLRQCALDPEVFGNG